MAGLTFSRDQGVSRECCRADEGCHIEFQRVAQGVINQNFCTAESTSALLGLTAAFHSPEHFPIVELLRCDKRECSFMAFFASVVATMARKSQMSW